jgi:MoaA/NifB/PqqE/SkfB family radical SAM enzyme
LWVTMNRKDVQKTDIGKLGYLLYSSYSPRFITAKIAKKLNKPYYPQWFNFAVTYQCNSRCTMCNIWQKYVDDPKKYNDELTIDEIEQFLDSSRYLKKLKYMVITGGEVFLRNDLVDIVNLIQNKGINVADFPTNGFATKTIINQVRKLLEIKDDLTISLSIDGKSQTHNRMRGLDNAYDLAIKTLKELILLQKSHDNLNIKISSTIDRMNFRELYDVALLSEKYHTGLNFRFVQTGNYFDNSSLQQNKMTGKEYTELEKIINKINILRNKKLKDRGTFFIENMIQHEKEKKQVVPCYSGSNSFFLDPYGNIFPCLMIDKPQGNIKQDPFDKLWGSDDFKNIRKHINSNKCSCWIGCEAYPSIGLSGRYFKYYLEAIINKQAAIQ